MMLCFRDLLPEAILIEIILSSISCDHFELLSFLMACLLALHHFVALKLVPLFLATMTSGGFKAMTPKRGS